MTQNQHRHQAGQQKRPEAAHHHQSQPFPAKSTELDRPDGNALLHDFQHSGRGQRFGGITLVLAQLIEGESATARVERAAPTQFREQPAFALEFTSDRETGEGDRDERRRGG